MNTIVFRLLAVALAFGLTGGVAHASWSPQDLTAAAGVGGTVHSLTSYTASGTKHVVYTDMDQFCLTGPYKLNLQRCARVIELYNDGFSLDWHPHDLTISAKATGAALDTPLTSYAFGASQHVIYIDLDGHVIELSNYSGSDPEWSKRDLAASAGAPPASSQALTSYVFKGTQHVVYIGGNQIIELSNDGSDPQWYRHNLTQNTGTPSPLSGALTSYADSNYQHVAFIAAMPSTSGGHIYELKNDGYNPNWDPKDLTADAGAPLAAAALGGLASFTVGTSEHIVYRGCLDYTCKFGGLVAHDIHRSGTETKWHDRNLSVAWDAPVIAFWFKQRIRLVGVGTTAGDRSVWEYSFPALSPPENTNVTSDAHAPVALNPGGVMTAYTIDGTQHLVYVDTSGHVRDLSD